jgi:hypothetical protein
MRSNRPAVIVILLFWCVTHSSSQATHFDCLQLFPDTQYVPVFSADGTAHLMSLETLELTRKFKASMGTLFPVADINLFGIVSQLSAGGSVHFEVRHAGQAHIVSDEYYIDYVIIDIPLAQKYFLRIAGGHTSHHLSDNWYEELHLSSAFHYARDYVKLFCVYHAANSLFFYAGVNYGYIVTIKQRITKPWHLQAGGEVCITRMWDVVQLYYAGDVKMRQEADFAATISHQIGFKFTSDNARNLRAAFQLRYGLDERGQFFPQHRMLSTVGIYFDL